LRIHAFPNSALSSSKAFRAEIGLARAGEGEKKQRSETFLFQIGFSHTTFVIHDLNCKMKLLVLCHQEHQFPGTSAQQEPRYSVHFRLFLSALESGLVRPRQPGSWVGSAGIRVVRAGGVEVSQGQVSRGGAEAPTHLGALSAAACWRRCSRAPWRVCL
jgi:hypothetical protein